MSRYISKASLSQPVRALLDKEQFAACDDGFGLFEMGCPSALSSKMALTCLQRVSTEETMRTPNSSRSCLVSRSMRVWLAFSPLKAATLPC